MKTAEQFILEADANVADRPAPDSNFGDFEHEDLTLFGEPIVESGRLEFGSEECEPLQRATLGDAFPVDSDLAHQIDEQPWMLRTRVAGTEALAFYKSPRFLKQGPFPGRWGIFYFAEAIDWLALELAIDANALTVTAEHRIAAQRLLREHEHFHFEVDLWCAGLESQLNSPRYRRISAPRTGIPAIHQVEEAIANQRAFKWASRVGHERFARRLFLRQPGAYARFTESESDLRAELAGNYVFLSRTPVPFLAPIAPQSPDAGLVDLTCPEWLIRPSASLHRILHKTLDAKLLPQFAAYGWQISETAEQQLAKSKRGDELRELLTDAMQKVVHKQVYRGLDCKKYRGDKVYTIRLSRGDRASFCASSVKPRTLVVLEVGKHADIAEGRSPALRR